MAEIYKRGIVRVIYKSSGFTTGLVVNADILLPNLSWIFGVEFSEVGNGIYYADIKFNTGLHSIVFYENGVKTTVQVYDIRRSTRSISMEGTIVGL